MNDLAPTSFTETEATVTPREPRGKRGSVDRRPVLDRAIVLHPTRSRHAGLRPPQARLEEAVGLAQALDLDVCDAQIVNLREVVPSTLFGKGKVADFAALCVELDAHVVVVDDALTPVQQRNLEKAMNAKVVDRTGLILEIFARRARTREGKLQVELARLAYEKSRLVRTWTHLERQRGGFGFMGGPGETQIEADRRLLTDRIVKLKLELEEVRRTRTLHRSARKRTPYPIVALVGYTNAGKSTLFNRLTDGDVLAKDMLFATLDPTLRTLKLPDGRSAIMSDTVGFISDLPHELVEAFRATLEEVQEADVILHVRDIAAADSAAEAQDVRDVLGQLGLGEAAGRMIEVWNKIDRLDEDDHDLVQARARRSGENGGPIAVPVSATTGEGAASLLKLIADRVDTSAAVDFVLESGDGQALAWLYRHGRVEDRSADDEGALTVSVRLDEQALGQFERQFPSAHLKQA